MSLFTFIVKNALRNHSPEISGTGEKDRTQKSSIERTKLPLFWAGISLRGGKIILTSITFKTRSYASFR